MIFVLKEKYFNKKISKFLTDTLAKISQNIFTYPFVLEHSKHFFLFWAKKLSSISGGAQIPSFIFWRAP